MNHSKNCNCEICNSGKEERQFAVMKLRNGEGCVLWDAEEISSFYSYLDNCSPLSPNYTTKNINSSEYVLAYGVIIPNPLVIADCRKEAERLRNFAFATLSNDTIYTSLYKDICISDQKVYKNHLPCAVLLQTSFNLELKRDFGFGYPMFVRYKTEDTEDGFLNIFDNIANRPFVLCVRDVVKKFKEYPNEWKSYINIQSCIKTAKELI